MKKFKCFLLLFIATFVIGGFYSASAYTTSRSLVGLKADFLGEPHYIPDIIGRNGATPQAGVTKTNFSVQKWSMTIKDDRKILVAVTNQYGTVVSGNNWFTVNGTTGGLVDVPNSSGMISAPSSETGHTFAVAAKLSLPWVQAEVSSGTWVIDN